MGSLQPPAAIAEEAPKVQLTRPEIDGKLARVPVVALVNADDAPFLTNGRIGYFYLDPTEALLSLKLLQKNSPEARLKVITLPEVYFPLVRGEQADLGGDLRLRPSRRQIVWANRALAFQKNENSLLPKSLDEDKGQVPVFYSERVSYGEGASATFPFFLRKEDLDAAFVELQGATAASSGAATTSHSTEGSKALDITYRCFATAAGGGIASW